MGFTGEWIIEELKKEPLFVESRRIGVYISTVMEADTTCLISDLLTSGEKTVFIPNVDGDQMDMLRVDDMDDYAHFTLNRWGILEPPREGIEERENPFASEIPLDLLIVPAVAFTRDGHRLGHGKGYYDKFLEKYEKVFGKARLPTSMFDIFIHTLTPCAYVHNSFFFNMRCSWIGIDTSTG
eukprot:TRINITY_DN631_c0_g1_i3.p1 TRINITY_DN631_c0_g1~~TRINITY_DN631_c0_g1_i3.p1  ORF type:complete len:182 (+),score=43.74 TRINITY_DN631_c0_g1_i3:255-800(+)